MPELLESEVLQKERYINTLTFTFLLTTTICSMHFSFHLTKLTNSTQKYLYYKNT